MPDLGNKKSRICQTRTASPKTRSAGDCAGIGAFSSDSVSGPVPAPSVPSVLAGSVNHGAHILRLGVIDATTVGLSKSTSLSANLD